jgi:hypothetical protein
MKHVRWFVAVVSMAIALVCSAPALAAPEPISVKVVPIAQVQPDGSARVSVLVRCAPFGQVLEANVSLSQDDGAVSGMGGLGPITCDRRWHVASSVVRPFDGSFRRGRAFASAFVLLLDPATGTTRQGQDSGTVLLR